MRHGDVVEHNSLPGTWRIHDHHADRAYTVFCTPADDVAFAYDRYGSTMNISNLSLVADVAFDRLMRQLRETR